MAVTIREITEQDAYAVARLSGELGYGASVPEIAKRIRAIATSQDHCAYVAEADGKPVGWVHGCHTLRLESGDFAEIGGLVVNAGHRGGGIGALLVEQVKAWARERSLRKIRVRCNSIRFDAHAFYTRIGFSEAKEQKVFDCSL